MAAKEHSARAGFLGQARGDAQLQSTARPCTPGLGDARLVYGLAAVSGSFRSAIGQPAWSALAAPPVAVEKDMAPKPVDGTGS